MTTGPMLLVRVNEKDPGSVLKPTDIAPVARIAGLAKSSVPLKSLEIVANGEVVRTIPALNRQTDGKGYETVIDEKLTLDQSSWIAVRCFEDRPDKRVRFAHTAPFHIDIPGKPLKPRQVQVEYLIKRIEDELARHAEVLPASALEEYREALRVYKEIGRTAR